MKSSKKYIIIFIIILIPLLFGFFLYKEGTLPVNKTNTVKKSFTIKQGEGLSNIAKNLEIEGLIRNKMAFYIVIKQLGYEKKIQAGQYNLSPSMDATQIAKTLTHGTFDEAVTIVEGLRKEEIAPTLAKQFNISEAEFNSAAREGYVFPDTYQMPSQSSVEAILTFIDKNFKSKYTKDIQDAARKNGLTEDQVITLASIVEREAGKDSERQQVADILFRRIQEGMPLQVDATIQYALGYQADEKKWWKSVLSLDDLAIKSPYNTYLSKGLPPTPICNPGIMSIKAAAFANSNTPYLFYLHGKDGKIHYAKTGTEHEANIKKYLQ